jgi:hypothetical protein
MKKIINIFDLYGKHISLYTKSSSKATTCVGFLFTVISFMLLSLILYFECYEIFKRENPSIISYRQNLNKNNSTLSISNNAFNYYINIERDFELVDYLNYFEISSNIGFIDGEDLPSVKVSYEHCNDKDRLHF